METSSRHHILGYGSLMSSESRARTGETGLALPVRVHGFERGWWLRSSRFTQGIGMTALGVVSNSEGTCTGVLSRVAEAELPRFDAREAGYTREPIPYKDVKVIDQEHDLKPSDKFWVYCMTERQPPTPMFPIVHSYLDVVISGTLEVSAEFAHEFVASTSDWQHLTDDRASPVYIRASAQASAQAPLIDAVLQEHDVTVQHYHPGSAEPPAESVDES
eukprot:m.267498 g.267498  ORF g.267498 m.267498 type:complete len:218 (-) comp15640_c1_seq7:2381-3034(-)